MKQKKQIYRKIFTVNLLFLYKLLIINSVDSIELVSRVWEGHVMLKYFSVKNFKQFKERVVLDFSDVRDYNFNNGCIANGLLKNGIIYGKNASGKTNFGLAIMDINDHLVDKMKYDDSQGYYANADSPENPVEFTYVFQFDNVEVTYCYSKDKLRNLLSETFSVNQDLVFSYDFLTNEKEISTNEEYGLQTLNWEFQDRGISILRYIANNTKLAANSPIRQVVHFVSGMLWFRSLGGNNNFVGFPPVVEDMLGYIIRNGLVGEFEQFINQHGVAEKIKVIEELPGKKGLYFDHKNPIPFALASSGTTALIALYYWYKHFREATFIIIDEFDAFYHFELAEKVVKLLIDTVVVQAILTSHNTNLLTNRMMRADCYFNLHDGKLVSFANSTSREIREGNNLEKLFIGGEFGE